MCQYTQYFYECDHSACQSFKTRMCKNSKTGHHQKKTTTKIVPGNCYKCKEKVKVEDSTDGSGQEESLLEGSTTSQRSSKNKSDFEEIWYIEKRTFKNPGFTNLNPFSAASLRPKNKRQRRESTESLSPRSLPTRTYTGSAESKTREQDLERDGSSTI